MLAWTAGRPPGGRRAVLPGHPPALGACGSRGAASGSRRMCRGPQGLAPAAGSSGGARMGGALLSAPQLKQCVLHKHRVAVQDTGGQPLRPDLACIHLCAAACVYACLCVAGRRVGIPSTLYVATDRLQSSRFRRAGKGVCIHQAGHQLGRRFEWARARPSSCSWRGFCVGMKPCAAFRRSTVAKGFCDRAHHGRRVSAVLSGQDWL
jgi:hypothetical protein